MLSIFTKKILKWIIKNGRNLGRYTPHYGQFKIVYDPFFEQYDSVLFLDSDIFPVDKLEENIFDVPVGHLGICTEDLQPDIRKKLLVLLIIMRMKNLLK